MFKRLNRIYRLVSHLYGIKRQLSAGNLQMVFMTVVIVSAWIVRRNGQKSSKTKT